MLFLLRYVQWHDLEGDNAANYRSLFDYEAIIGDKATYRDKNARDKEKYE